MARRRRTELDFPSLSVEGGLFPGDFLARVAHLEAPHQSEAEYGVPKNLRLRDEIGRYFRIAQGLWDDFSKARARKGGDPRKATVDGWLLPFLSQSLGFSDIAPVGQITVGERIFPIGHAASGGRVPLVLSGHNEDLNAAQPRYGDGNRRRSPFLLAQEYLNAGQGVLWAIVSNGTTLRLLRDNPSLTRPAYIEADLERIFQEELYADFVALWLLYHASRFGKAGTPASECVLERWLEAAQEAGSRARERLRFGVADALRLLGTGFVSHPKNAALHTAIENGALTADTFFQQLLRLVYRLLFLFTIEERRLLHPRGCPQESMDIYREGYSLAHLRELAIGRRRYDRYGDLWQGLLVTFAGLAKGESALALPPLGGLFRADQCPDLESALLPNHALLGAIERLAFFQQDGVLARINYRDMGPEELGSVYEALLELVPEINTASVPWRFRFVGDDAGDASVAGNARKLTGSYYTPDSLVQELIKSALEPVIAERVASRGDDPAAAVLGIKVIDPACGSGHFLLAAARRLAEQLAKHRLAGGQPTPDDYRHALRDVIGHCIYGVDRNPLALELAKTALWLEGYTPDRPLSFLDHHLRCGDALIGVLDPKVMEEGIPPEAFKLLSGDDKETVRVLAKQNAAARKALTREKGRSQLVMQELALYNVESGLELDAMPDENLAEIDAKREAFERARKAAQVSKARRMADSFVAAFFMPKTKELEAVVPTTEDLHRLLRDVPQRTGVLEAAHEYARKAQAFHWKLEFPGVFEQGGFDVLLGNPPWERVKLQQEEFFAAREPEIAKAKNAAVRNLLIAALPETNPLLASEWTAALHKAETASEFLRSSGQYPLGGVGDVNTYAVFADLFRQLIRPIGAAALLVPNGLVTGYTYRAFLRHLLQSRTLASFYGFENEDKIFPDVHNETKFGLLTITGERYPVEQPWFTAHIRQPEQIYDPLRRYQLTAGQIEAISPNTLNLPVFRWAADAEVAATIHAAAPVLIRRYEDGRVENPWNVRLRTMFHMANDSNLFLDHADIARRITRRSATSAILDDGTSVYPLYEGKMLWHFDHRYGTYEGQTEKQSNKGVLPHVDDATHDDPQYRVQPRYWVAAEKVSAALAQDSDRKWFFAWRDVGPSERTFVGCIVPVTAVGHKAPILISRHAPKEITALIGILSSLVIDYDARQRSSLMTFFVIEQLPLLLPETLTKQCLWLGAAPCEWLSSRVLELSYTSVELIPFALSIGNQSPPFRWIPERRVILQGEIDAAVLHLYGLKRAQAEWLLDSFTVLRKYEETDHGEFRTKRIVLEIYDAMQESILTGRPYETRLDPPPADFRCCNESVLIEANGQ